MTVILRSFDFACFVLRRVIATTNAKISNYATSSIYFCTATTSACRCCYMQTSHPHSSTFINYMQLPLCFRILPALCASVLLLPLHAVAAIHLTSAFLHNIIFNNYVQLPLCFRRLLLLPTLLTSHLASYSLLQTHA